MDKEFHMVGGEEEASYTRNSSYQRLILREVKPILVKCAEELFGDLDQSFLNCIRFADLGCSSGPNLYFTAQNIIESIGQAIGNNGDQEFPSVEYFLNDLVSNDFNLIFKGLPEFLEKLNKGPCFFAAMPGSFYGKLFRDRSMHFLHSSYCLHWLSQVPNGLVTERGTPGNKGSIYCGKRSSPEVHQAYLDQFTQDFSVFIKMRSQEMVQHGQMLLTFLCKNEDEVEGSHINYIVGMALRDMVAEGQIKEEKLDSFNLPFYMPSLHETKQIVEDEGSFDIQNIHTFRTRLDAAYEAAADDAPQPEARARYVASSFRAAHEPIFESQFGEGIMDKLFNIIVNKLVNPMQLGQCFFNTLVISLRKK